MSLFAAMLIAVLPAAAGAATVYKWLDAQGIVTYGNKPPAGMEAQALELTAGHTVEAPAAQGSRLRPGAWHAAAPRATPVHLREAPSRGMSFDTFMRLSRGMTEGELVMRAGRPDWVTLEEFARVPARSYHYFPTARDPFHTIVTLRGGTIYNLERTRQF
jgi:hypothetical protein